MATGPEPDDGDGPLRPCRGHAGKGHVRHRLPWWGPSILLLLHCDCHHLPTGTVPAQTDPTSPKPAGCVPCFTVPVEPSQASLVGNNESDRSSAFNVFIICSKAFGAVAFFIFMGNN